VHEVLGELAAPWLSVTSTSTSWWTAAVADRPRGSSGPPRGRLLLELACVHAISITLVAGPRPAIFAELASPRLCPPVAITAVVARQGHRRNLPTIAAVFEFAGVREGVRGRAVCVEPAGTDLGLELW